MIYVISDIHGQWKRYQSILDQISLSAEDTLYVLGDVIDRGADGIRILQDIMARPNAKMLLGNHELMMLNCIDNPKSLNSRERWARNGSEPTQNAFQALSPEEQRSVLDYLHALELEVSLTVSGQSFRLVHAAPAYLFDIVEFSDDLTYFCVWYRMSFEEPLYKDEMLIIGHTPTAILGDRPPFTCLHRPNVIDIDCGCAYPDGRLCCLRLDDMRTFYSAE